MKNDSNEIALKVLVPFMVNGEIAAKGEIVLVTRVEAKDLLYREMAELTDIEDAPGFLTDDEQVVEGIEPPAAAPFEVVEPGEKTGETTIDGKHAEVREPKEATGKAQRGRPRK